ncbi:LysR family transcriptional regulator [Enterovirga rhinocerotis]|uniref:DNA-binding transcriptional LysR family regulator n=1 Tax=Enterovirga rhinocerotis TaxID=1339210 RepID=A0A4R7C163_9HYPH|nr:LysR family transcriptional regulator [Enterovirga rhinocerotis]TDR90237.1 DNA-binding transcriptional LysR family regulator [Enterovirga rhinocerotis]
MHRNDFRTLQLFVAACELKSLSRAAQRLGIAPSAASRRIQLLEHDVKGALLERLPHGVVPTPAGTTFLRFARDILHLVDRADHMLSEHQSGVRGFVRVASSSSVLLARLAYDISRFASSHPDIQLDLEERDTETTLEMVRSKQVDIGLVVSGADTQPLVTFSFGGDRLVLAVPQTHRLALRERLRFSEFSDETFVTLGHGTAVRKVLVEQARLLGAPLLVRVQANTFEAMALLASQGLGVAVLPQPVLAPLKEAYGLKEIEIVEPWARRNFVLCVRSMPELDPPAQKLLRFLLDP